VILDTSKALELNENYVKVLVRRSVGFENLDKLEEALRDLQKAIEIDSTILENDKKLKRRYEKLELEVKERQEKLKEETMDKLKDVGNSLLGEDLI